MFHISMQCVFFIGICLFLWLTVVTILGHIYTAWRNILLSKPSFKQTLKVVLICPIITKTHSINKSEITEEYENKIVTLVIPSMLLLNLLH